MPRYRTTYDNRTFTYDDLSAATVTATDAINIPTTTAASTNGVTVTDETFGGSFPVSSFIFTLPRGFGSSFDATSWLGLVSTPQNNRLIELASDHIILHFTDFSIVLGKNYSCPDVVPELELEAGAGDYNKIVGGRYNSYNIGLFYVRDYIVNSQYMANVAKIYNYDTYYQIYLPHNKMKQMILGFYKFTLVDSHGIKKISMTEFKELYNEHSDFDQEKYEINYCDSCGCEVASNTEKTCWGCKNI